ncbi:MAG TPA: LLM class flavin-dependent oxidoreductase [Bradyrhizobium sp.]|nr:LLM class flavin-dependent oxidoreductase [Bradyrhizobium sp.]
MNFGIFSNGFRKHTTAAESMATDIEEIVLADRLGFRDAYISEHHGEIAHAGRVDVLPVPELLMCKAAALTNSIRMGSAVKLIHLQHPVDVAVQAAVTQHLIGGDRFIFGFGTGFPNPAFSNSRGLTFDDRFGRMMESLDLILKCWGEEKPFDWQGKHWRGNDILATPKPATKMQVAIASDSLDLIKMAAERGYTVLSAFIEPPARVRSRSQEYFEALRNAGRDVDSSNLTASRIVYISDSKQQAIEEMRSAVAFEVSVQADRGFLRLLKEKLGIDVPNDERAIDRLVESGLYIVGSPGEVIDQLKTFYLDCGGFGTLLLVTGKDWATREKRENSLRQFMSAVAPELRLFAAKNPLP